MSYKLSEDIMITINGSVQVLREGTTVSEMTLDLDSPAEAEPDIENKLLSIVQDWINEFKSRFSESGWSKIVKYLQPALDAIHSGDLKSMKSATIDIANKSEKLADVNPKAKNALDQIHSLYTKLLGVARGVFGEDIDELINIINESSNKISEGKIGLKLIDSIILQAQTKLNSTISKSDPIFDEINEHLKKLRHLLN